MFDFHSCLSASQRHFLAAEFSCKPVTNGMFNMSTDATGGKRPESAFIAYFNFWGEGVEQRGRRLHGEGGRRGGLEELEQEGKRCE